LDRAKNGTDFERARRVERKRERRGREREEREKERERERKREGETPSRERNELSTLFLGSYKQPKTHNQQRFLVGALRDDRVGACEKHEGICQSRFFAWGVHGMTVLLPSCHPGVLLARIPVLLSSRHAGHRSGISVFPRKERKDRLIADCCHDAIIDANR